MDHFDVVIIGGGAAGLFAAAVLSDRLPTLNVVVLEKNRRPLEKVRISGGGRCNLTHACSDIREFVKNYPRGGRELIGPFNRFGPVETMQWFEGHGVPLVTLEDGCVFPKSDTSEDVINALLFTAGRGNVEVRTRSEVCGIEKEENGFVVTLATGDVLSGSFVLVATGGGDFLHGLGHAVAPFVPSLFTLNTSDQALTELAGIVMDPVRVSGVGVKADGALLITHNGVSGPAVLRLSSFGARALADIGYQFEMHINWLPDHNEESVFHRLEEFRLKAPKKKVAAWSPVGVPSRLWKLIVSRAMLSPEMEWNTCSNKVLRRIASGVCSFSVPVSDRNPHREEFVTCGGVSLKEIDFKTMSSRKMEGLHFAGEVLDVDALTGGFNLQAAWTTGYLAAIEFCRRFEKI